IVWDQHELPPDGLLRSSLYRRLFAWLVARCDRIVMASHERRALVKAWLGQPDLDVDVLENFPDAHFATMAAGELPATVREWLDGSSYLLAQGGANPDRHLESLVAGLLATTGLKLVVVGPYSPAQPEALERTHGPSVHERVRFTGSVPQLELP